MREGEPAIVKWKGEPNELNRKLKYRIGILLFGLYLSVGAALTGCSGREEVFFEENGGLGIAAESENEQQELTGDKNTDISSAPSAERLSEQKEELPKIFVDICGAVANPGVYELEAGSRIFQAVDAAGGYLPEAAQNYLNRASCLTDGQQIYVPTEEELKENPEEMPEVITGKMPEKSEQDDKINLNTADASQLSTLSGIGQSKAEAIVAYREAHGGFASIEEIMNVEGIKEGTFSKIKDKISAG